MFGGKRDEREWCKYGQVLSPLCPVLAGTNPTSTCHTQLVYIKQNSYIKLKIIKHNFFKKNLTL